MSDVSIATSLVKRILCDNLPSNGQLMPTSSVAKNLPFISH